MHLESGVHQEMVVPKILMTDKSEATDIPEEYRVNLTSIMMVVQPEEDVVQEMIT